MAGSDLRLDQMASMGYHGLIAVTIRVQDGTHLLPYCVTDFVIHGSDITGIGRPRHAFHDGGR